MIRHMVFLKPRAEVSNANFTELMQELDGLRGHLKGIADFQFRDNVSIETAVVHGFSRMFWFDFETETARDAYLVDPQHKAIGRRLVAACDGGTDGLFVCDIRL